MYCLFILDMTNKHLLTQDYVKFLQQFMAPLCSKTFKELMIL
nr:MAG TPA: hypothetical protein [Caudoviricetes sp.]